MRVSTLYDCGHRMPCLRSWPSVRPVIMHGASDPPCHVQVVLGISTLLTYVPPSLGTAHQAGALTLLTLALCLLHTLRRNSALKLRASQMQLGTPAALAAVLAVGTAVTQFS